ncbi:efflux RND transporter permease subunit [Bowmanella yangjiangensis]|uniref:Efflux RND transporter permease subunit n=1 Tax=Bowmanella yangjiangensis TaxID=2811230 RepID=A0ABS3CXH6_9ALTE|nr:efflux RND transporter permease subunit [Bowmanella yangjiangensis]MBN7821808.1 efflux RND transporter permease subunit [Bowmanella yangjiangensis]
MNFRRNILPPAASLRLRTTPGNDAQDMSPCQQLIEDVIEPRLARIPGVAQVNLASQRPRELRISLDLTKLLH